MWRRVCVLVVVAGCWSDDPQINGFTADQWAQLQLELTLPLYRPCVLPTETAPQARCDQLAALGKQLFFDPALSSNDAVSCGTCHDPHNYFIDSRAENNVSLGVPVMGVPTWTKHNAMATVDMALKYTLAKAFTWTGKAKFYRPGAVLELAISGPPFETTQGAVANLVRMKYSGQYLALFPNPMQADDEVIQNVETAFDAYMFRITSLDAPFNRWLAGEDDAIPDSAKRGFQVFAGRGGCIECHNGPAFSDFDYHDTGVPQSGPNVPVTDLGRGDVTQLHDGDDGKFMTPSLRNVARTAPYMHDGVFDSLGEVIEFYRRGGGGGAYSGTQDPRITRLDLSDDDVHDLADFLESLNGATLSPDGMGSGSGSGSGGPMCGVLTPCGNACVNLGVDPMHCGSCTLGCMPAMACVTGICMPAGPCQFPEYSCPSGCANLLNDPMNCGACGHVCSTYCMNGLCG